MPDSDNSPERRNLVLTSFAIIVYYLAGGDIAGGSIHLTFINIDLGDKTVLTVIAWILLVWFYIRFRQTYKTNLANAIHAELQPYKNDWFLHRYLKYKGNGQQNTHCGYALNELTKDFGGWFVQITTLEDVNINKAGQPEQLKEKGASARKIKLNWAWFGLLRGYLLCRMAISHRGIGSYSLPPALFYAAVALGIYNLIAKIITNAQAVEPGLTYCPCGC